MKLKLKNFRCYESTTFDFGDDGLTLISGSSGKGKSTLMMAIEFALFGSGSKLQTYGKKSCSVELEISPDFKIMRQKCPNRLVVNDLYEDDAGESFIKNRFGSSMLSCYIPQNIRKTFVLMSPAERLEFLESLVLTNVNIQEVKSKTKSLIKKLCDEHNESIGSLKAMGETLSTIVKPTKVNFPVKVSSEKYEKVSSNERVKINNATILINRNEKKLESLISELGEQNILNSVIIEKKSQINNLENQILNFEDYIFEKEKLIELKTKLQHILSSKSFFEKKILYEKSIQQLNEVKEEEMRELVKNISEISTWDTLSKTESKENLTLWKDEIAKLSKKKNIIEKLSKFKSIDKLKDSLSTLSSEHEQFISDYETTKKTISAIEFQQTVHTCPSCKINLRFENGSLVTTQHIQVDGNVNSLKNTLKILNEKIGTCKKKIQEVEISIIDYKKLNDELENLVDVDDSAEEEFESLKEYIRVNSDAEMALFELKRRLDSKLYSHSVTSLENKTKLLKKELDKLGNLENVSIEMSEEDIRKQISEQELLKDRFDRINLQKSTINNQISKIQLEIKSIESNHNKKWKNRDISDIESEIDTCKSIISEQKMKFETSSQLLEKIEKYYDYIEKYNVWNKINSQHTLLSEKEKTLSIRYTSACTFRDKILEAESISITNTINNINSHAQFYLDSFFPDDPISIRLVAFKETKDNQKPQINLEIEYKGIDHDLNMLSGGEMSRVVLAFTLALSEIHNTPFVMLDESTSSLDQELTSSVVDGLKENFGNKLVLLIAHQVVQGSFDKIVRL
jgi:exonuclease SbcC